MSEELMTLEQAATYLGISKATVYRRLAELKIRPANDNPLLKRPKESKYRKSDIEKIKEHLFRAA